MDSYGGGGGRPTAEEVISKLKDDGDFDALRLKIVRKVKENDDLRNCIILEVKQSEALNRDGSENLKPRQLSDAIHQEIGNKIMGQISDELWKIIRSDDGMKNEIRETVESVYKKLITLPKEEVDHSSTLRDQPPDVKEHGVAPTTASTCETTMPCEDDPLEPPGFGRCDQVQINNCSKEEHMEKFPDQKPGEHEKQEFHGSPGILPPDDDGPPGFTTCVERPDQLPGASDDEDPDVPPGFG